LGTLNPIFTGSVCLRVHSENTATNDQWKPSAITLNFIDLQTCGSLKVMAQRGVVSVAGGWNLMYSDR